MCLEIIPLPQSLHINSFMLLFICNGISSLYVCGFDLKGMVITIENDSQRKPNLRKYLIFSIIAVVVVIFCVSAILFNTPDSKFKRNLKEVCTQAFTFPDSVIHESLLGLEDAIKNNVPSETMNGDFDGTAIKLVVTPYLTEDGLRVFMGRFYTFGDFCAGTDWRTEVSNVTIEPHSEKDRVDFVVTASLYNDDEKVNDIKFSGTAQHDGTGKIQYWALDGETELLFAELRENILFY